LVSYHHSRLAAVEWWYETKDGADYRNITMQPPSPVHDSYYPWLGEPVASYFARYLKDGASVLFIMGEPGTGKTSLLRHFIYQNQLKAVITYEEKLLNTDEMFVNFLSMGDDAVMVIEDAESLVNAREVGGGTTLMTRFLNVSDGLVHLANRKIIFTTNQNDFRGVDPALIRPGRCFGAIKARALTYEEACVAARDAGLPEPEQTGRPIVLADLFNPPQSQSVERIGIGVGR
jgi:SpoVK/Ycf46/Vps4 family AAA+-type ATPase